MIHPSAIVSPNAKLAADVSVGPYVVIEDDVEVGEGSTIEAHAILRRGSRIGKKVTVGNHAVVAGLPQDLRFDPATPTYAEIGDGTTLRESVTINRATKENGSTRIGASCFIMACSHVGHDSVVGDRVVMGNGTLLAGHVGVGAGTFFGGGAAVHQFCRVGEGVMVGGHAAVSMDVAPFTKMSERNALFGLNLIGLRRRGLPRETIDGLQTCYRKVFLEAGNIREKAAALLAEGCGDIAETRAFLAFFEDGKRGFARPGRGKS